MGNRKGRHALTWLCPVRRPFGASGGVYPGAPQRGLMSVYYIKPNAQTDRAKKKRAVKHSPPIPSDNT